MEFVGKKAVLELDFLNRILADTENTIVWKDGNVTVPSRVLDKDHLDRFLGILDSFWHTEVDQLERVVFYDDNSLFCQRKKLKYDFSSGQKVYTTYTFVGYTTDQVIELRKKIVDFIQASDHARLLKVRRYVSKVDENILFYDKTYLKRMQERNNILNATDWRVLPDVEDSYPGEKDMWKKYRQTVRGLTLEKLEDYPTPLDFFKAVKTFKWPIDPKFYWDQYPEGLDNDGNPVEYLSTDDQWVERDTESSRDFIEGKLIHITHMRDNYLAAERIMRADVKEMMKLLRLEDFVEAGIDYTKIYTEEELEDIRGL